MDSVGFSHDEAHNVILSVLHSVMSKTVLPF